LPGASRLWPLLWLTLAVVSLAIRPAWPVDETRYLGVAWSMWSSGDQLVPQLAGEPYADKPPLLFWLVQAGWWLTGVNEVAARAVAPLFALATLLLSRRLARRLWPDDARVADLAPLVLAGTLLWSLWSTLLMFDVLLVTFELAAVVALLDARDGAGWRAWLAMGLALGLALLTKGPVALAHVLPLGLAAPFWAGPRRWGGWSIGLSAATLTALAVLAAWALPAALSGGDSYRDNLLWDQTLKRLGADGEHLHQRPWWWLAALFPIVLYPWALWPRVWRGLGRLPLDGGARLCLLWFLSVLLLVAVVPSKQVHYLLPLLPPVALLVARALPAGDGGRPARDGALTALLPLLAGLYLLSAPGDAVPEAAAGLAALVGGALVVGGLLLAAVRLPSGTRGIGWLAGSSVASLLLLLLLYVASWLPVLDVRPLATTLSALQRQGRPIASTDKYRGQYDFAGRLRDPVLFLEPHDVPAWVTRHPGGLVVGEDAPRGAGDLSPVVRFPNGVGLWTAAALDPVLNPR
jgi:4-amino-4-deoxy-L-arabinose transferase-like glycosyltransferase